MAVFSDLPNEIVAIILPLVQPEDLENFAQVARRVQELARSLLQTHKEMIRKYRTLNDGAISSLLKIVLDNPRIGHYVRMIDLCNMEGANALQDSFTEDELASIQVAATEANEYLWPNRNVEHILQLTPDMAPGQQGLRLALLLPFLPNLNVLKFRSARNGSASFWVEKVIANVPRAAKPALTKLTKIQIDSNLGCGPFVGNLFPFAALPSLKELSVSRSAGWTSKFNVLVPASEVTKLELFNTIADSETLCSFLKIFRKLEMLTFSKDSEWGSPMFDASLLRDTLLAHTKSTLQTLTILGPLGQLSFMGSFREFDLLKNLRTHLAFLLPTKEAQLSAAIPGSLLHLCLHDTRLSDACTYEEILRDTLSDKLSGALHLESLNIVAPECIALCGEHIDLREDCREKGLDVTFSLETLDDEDPYLDLLQDFQH